MRTRLQVEVSPVGSLAMSAACARAHDPAVQATTLGNAYLSFRADVLGAPFVREDARRTTLADNYLSGRNCSVRKPCADGGAGGRDRLTRNSARRSDIAGTNETPAVWPVPKGTAQGPFRGLRILW